MRAALPALCLLVVIAACDPGPTDLDREPWSIELAGPTHVTAADSARFSAVVRDRAGDTLDLAVGWSTSDESIASIDGDGLVTAHRAGAVDVMATAGTRLATARLTVVPRFVAAVEILEVNGQDPAEIDPIIIAEDSIVVRVRVAVADTSAPAQHAGFDFSQTWFTWSGTQLNVQPGEVAEFTLRGYGRLLGEMDMRVNVTSFQAGAAASSETVRLRSTDPFFDVHIVSINGVPVREDGPTPVADRFVLELDVHAPEGAPDRLTRLWLRSELDDGTTLPMGASQQRDFEFTPGTHRVSMTAWVAPPGRYQVWPVAVLAGETTLQYAPMNPIEVEVTNSDVTPPEVALVSPADSAVVSVDNPTIVLDLADAESGLLGIQIVMDWRITIPGATVGPCSSGVRGWSNGLTEPVSQRRFFYQPASCFNFHLVPGPNPFIVRGWDNALNERELTFTLIYDPDAGTAGDVVAVAVEREGVVVRATDRHEVRVTDHGVWMTHRLLGPDE